MNEENSAKPQSDSENNIINKTEFEKNRTQAKRKFSFKVNLRKFRKNDENSAVNNEKCSESNKEDVDNQIKQKLTIRKLFRKSSIKKLITNVQRRVTSEFNFTVICSLPYGSLLAGKLPKIVQNSIKFINLIDKNPIISLI
jgi:hypothetical protein